MDFSPSVALSTHQFQLNFKETMVADASNWWWMATHVNLQGRGEDMVDETAAFGIGLLPINPPG